MMIYDEELSIGFKVSSLYLNCHSVHKFGLQKHSCLGSTVLQGKATTLNDYEIIFQTYVVYIPQE